MRPDMHDEMKFKINELIEKENEKIRQIEKSLNLKLLTKNLMTEFTIRKFVDKFRLKYRQKQEKKRKLQDDTHNKEILKINKNEQVIIEQEALNLSLMMDYCKVQMKGEKSVDMHLNSLNSLKMKEAKFSFIDDILIVMDDKQAVQEKIFLVTIDDVAAHGDLYIYLVCVSLLDIWKWFDVDYEE